MTDLITTDDLEPVTLRDGTQLDERQSLCAVLHATTDDTHEEIALKVGYAGASAVSRFLRSGRGREATRLALEQHLAEAGRVGLQTMLKLARTAKSENVRQLAAADLMDRAQLKLGEDEADKGRGNGSVNISFNLPANTEPKDVTISQDDQSGST